MSTVTKQQNITVEEYLNGELISDTKHELVNGQVYAMTGASKNHERISLNILSEFKYHLKNSPCEPFGSDIKIKVRDNFYYPDALVDCSVDETTPYYTKTPVIAVEVISKSTRKIDEQIKRMEYINIPTLVEYVIIEQDYVDVAVFRKSDQWRPTHYFLGDEIHFESIGLTLAVEEIYSRVNNEDMNEYTAKKQAKQQN
ncbi:hypothetical protein DS2_17140 [Catenovulum agarivorans DS-2]|uniref:Putative restriction endonuclease domain-containing protein n=1 Tax=Catenovulum agarivorans DS-2 TaxID=1328313 RepID=W7Q8Z4_9ALTE|nr:Uma2 family endonuclease [Catenovulum agarivorans]EWH08486.1 hypothetical protein DS2_17140 [Catenovulum agarivorans DS-2]